jgi:hypothetical protein
MFVVAPAAAGAKDPSFLIYCGPTKEAAENAAKSRRDGRT